MTNDTNLQFITDRINEVKSAIMYSLSDDLIRLPNSIVSAVKVDDEGQLWFMCDRPTYLPEQLPQSFPVRLHFYRKGKFFHMEISGAACITNETEVSTSDPEKRLLIRMDMKNITYKETEPNRKNGLQVTVGRAYQWVMRNLGIHPHDKGILPMPANHS